MPCTANGAAFFDLLLLPKRNNPSSVRHCEGENVMCVFRVDVLAWLFGAQISIHEGLKSDQSHHHPNIPSSLAMAPIQNCY